MKRYVGIDLGTTNSVICSFGGVDTRVWKSPDQSDVTPSAIYIDKRGHRYFGRRAYEAAPTDEKNAATLFKRYLGTNMTFTFESVGQQMTPEECSAEIIKLLFGYLPPDWRDDPETAVVITVPAAFNQMKKDAMLQAAQLAQLQHVAVMQEPVAAVMSVMKDDPVDGAFLVYDLGGGTFDISVAEHAGGQVNLLAQGGKEMCGGRDWDRLLWREAALPWLRANFNLPDDVERNPEYRRLRQLGLFACEQAKIELSAQEDAYIQMDEARIGQMDLDGKELYLDVPITRQQLTGLIQGLLEVTVDATRETLQKSGVRECDIRRIVFIGGPTVFPPLQSYVMEALGIQHKGSSNPMTAVAEGASIYAESIDWDSSLHRRKELYRRSTQADFDISYEQRIFAETARVAVVNRPGGPFAVEVVSEMDGWTSGRVALSDRDIVELPVRAKGVNTFRLALYDAAGQQVQLDDDKLVIDRVLATVSAIPSSHAIAIKALDQVGGKAVPVYLIHDNEQLPRTGSVALKSGKRLVAGSEQSISFSLWEGEIVDPIESNRYIGTYRIPGNSFSSGVIAVGADIICEFEIAESGELRLGATVPSVGAVFESRNFYSRFEGQVVLNDPSVQLKEANELNYRIAELQSYSYSADLARLNERVAKVRAMLQEDDLEAVQQAVNDLLDCQRDFALYRQGHLKAVRIVDLNYYAGVVDSFRDELDGHNAALLDGIYEEARRTIEHNPEGYDEVVERYRIAIFEALKKSDRYLIRQFTGRVSNPGDYPDLAKFNKLKAKGQSFIANGEHRKLLPLIGELDKIRKPKETVDYETMYDEVNVLRG